MRKPILNGYALAGINLYDSTPIGNIMETMSEIMPVGWMRCNHAELKQSDYPDLYKLLKDVPQCKSENEGYFCLPDYGDESAPYHIIKVAYNSVTHADDETFYGPVKFENEVEYKGNEIATVDDIQNDTKHLKNFNQASWGFHICSHDGIADINARIGDENYPIAMRSDLSTDFPSGITILDWLKNAQAGSSAEIVTPNYPSDAPTQGEYSLLVSGHGGRKTVIAFHYLGKKVFFRHLWHDDTQWRDGWQELTTKKQYDISTTTNGNGNFYMGSVSEMGIPICFKTKEVSNGEVNITIDHTGSIYGTLKNWNNSGAKLLNVPAQGTLYCI